MKIKKILYTVFLIIICFKGAAQKTVLKKAEKEYNKYAYVNAITIYERVAENGYQDEKMFQKLGNAYYFNAELAKAAKWYDALFSFNQQQEPEYYFRYAQVLKAIGDYPKSNKMFAVFNEKVAAARKEIFQNSQDNLHEIGYNSGRFAISNAGINSDQSDYGGAILNNKLVFASARDTGIATKKIFKWTNRYFTNLYTAEIKSDGSLESPKRFDKGINSKFNESTPVFTKDGNTMYFTRNNFLDGKRGRNNQKVTLLKIYKAEFVKGRWTNVIELPFNSSEYNVAHPALSLDEKKLYFASDMPGGFGQSDLYSVVINDDGTFGSPQNLGPVINTVGRETFPFVSGDNEIYFASDGRAGFGGLDIYAAQIKETGFDEVLNVGDPVNTNFDDFSFVMDTNTRQGFFSSNKEGGVGNDDLYKFTETRKLFCEKKLTGIVLDSQTNEVLSGAKVILLNDKYLPIAEVTSAEDGSYSFNLKCYRTYHIRVSKEDYETTETPTSIHPSDENPKLDVKLERIIKPITVGTDLAKTLNIPTIYFGLDQSFITKEAAFELEKVLAVMQQYPAMKIEVRSHTDSRQSKKYNMDLSNKRAKATIGWFVKKGIASDRISGRGYGESQPVNRCTDNVNCTEKEHQANRRSEFIIVSF